MVNSEVLVIGAGASGLMAACELAKAGLRVTVLEARERIGGRIYTQHVPVFSSPIEAGAEFVHGDLSTTQAVFKEAGVPFFPMDGTSYEVKKGKLQESEEFIADFDELLEVLNDLEQDMSLAAFLEEYFPDDAHQALRDSVIKFAEGYDAADIYKVSVLALREEWMSGGASNSFFPQGGYGQMMDFLAAEVKNAGGTIELNCTVQEVHWKPAHVQITCENGQHFTAPKALITVPLGVLLSEPGSTGHIRFSPALPEKLAALQTMGFGPVIKILLEFKDSFWEEAGEEKLAYQMPDLSFLMSDATPVPTWWTHAPEKTPLLTGWLAGPQALALKDEPDKIIVAKALESLAYIFNTTVGFLQEELQASFVANWLADPFARGAYAYATVASGEARETLSQPEQNTLFFAGEALYVGPAMGTVEAALVSGQESAQTILQAQ